MNIRNRNIVGVQVHHSTNLSDASRFAVNALTALEATQQKRDDPALEALLTAMRPLVLEIGVLRTEASERLVAFHVADSRGFRAARDGRVRWPDERAEGFVARCSCGDRCLYHDTRQGTPDDCSCMVGCAAHPDGDG